MSTEIWVALIGLAGVIVTSLWGPVLVEWVKRRFSGPPPPPPVDPFKEKWLARIDQLDREVQTERTAKTDCLVQCAQLRTELTHAQARLQRAEQKERANLETIQRLRARLDRLEEIVRNRDE